MPTAAPSAPPAPADNGWSKSDQATQYNTNASFVYSAKFTNGVVELLAPQPGEHILDLGCGSGDLILSPLLSSVLPSGRILGVDASPSLLSKARSNTSSSSFTPKERAQIDWVECDGQELGKLRREGEWDAVFSNAALHWMKRDPEGVVRGVHGLLKPGGRFVGEMGGALNMVGVRSTLHAVLAEYGVDAAVVDPWFFPTPEVYRGLLEKAGFRVEYCELIPRPTPLPTGLRGWLLTFASSFLSALPSSSAQEEVLDKVCKRLECDMKHDVGEGGEAKWTVMYVRLRFKAWKA
ncbi:hypothetical protein JCM8097_006291 [Rhodosporidiobolus ruineniae]